MDYEHSEQVAAAPDRLYGVLAKPENLAHFVPQLTMVRAIDDGHVEVEPDGDRSRLTLRLSTEQERDFDDDVVGTLDAVRRLLEAEV